MTSSLVKAKTVSLLLRLLPWNWCYTLAQHRDGCCDQHTGADGSSPRLLGIRNMFAKDVCLIWFGKSPFWKYASGQSALFFTVCVGFFFNWRISLFSAQKIQVSSERWIAHFWELYLHKMCFDNRKILARDEAGGWSCLKKQQKVVSRKTTNALSIKPFGTWPDPLL